MTVSKKLAITDPDFQRELFGNFDKNIRLIEDSFAVSIVLREDHIVVMGEEEAAQQALSLLTELFALVAKGESLTVQNIRYTIDLIRLKSGQRLSDLGSDVITFSAKGLPIKAKTHGQREYIKSIVQNDVTVGVGPAGTGKTYLAVAHAVRAFKQEEITRIILTRPAVEAGESLGFLPGDLKDKVDPYLRPLYDALFDVMGAEKFAKYMERGMIEVAPLAFMRGRTLDNSFIILDEAQNTTQEQMKMFLTRLGFGSKIVVNGDVTQIDLPKGKKSGLIHATEVLRDIESIGICHLTERDVVRHELVQRIIRAYDRNDKKIEPAQSAKALREKERTPNRRSFQFKKR